MNVLPKLLSDGRPLVMAVINITPDSFSDGGQLYRSGAPALDKILYHCESMVAEGADILDIGGESTRPGAAPVDTQQEMDRVLPVVEALNTRFATPVSVDTSNPLLMSASATHGAAMINDVRALRRPGALEAAVDSGLYVCLMHMRGEPGSMQLKPEYEHVDSEVVSFLLARARLCEAAGLARDKLLLDPGFGFGKTLEQNLTLFVSLPALVSEGYLVLVGVSRKSMIGAILDRPISQRSHGGTALALLAVQAGARVIRTHDVAATVDTLAIYRAIEGAKGLQQYGDN